MNDKDKDALTRQLLPVVEILVNEMMTKLNGTANKDDLRSYAYEGLVLAINRFDPSRGCAIKTYAQHRMKGAIYDGLYRSNGVTRTGQRFINACRSFDDYQAIDPVSAPVDKRDAVHKLASRLHDLATIYIATDAADAADTSSPHSTHQTPEQEMERHQHYEILHQAMNRLPEKEQLVVYEFFFKEKNLSEIARDTGRHKTWTGRVLKKGLRRLRREYNVLLKQPQSQRKASKHNDADGSVPPPKQHVGNPSNSDSPP